LLSPTGKACYELKEEDYENFNAYRKASEELEYQSKRFFDLVDYVNKIDRELCYELQTKARELLFNNKLEDYIKLSENGIETEKLRQQVKQDFTGYYQQLGGKPKDYYNLFDTDFILKRVNYIIEERLVKSQKEAQEKLNREQKT